ncbi:hypothetical protein ANANG_G00148280 [Anguilla anguilla]|uniref:Uncharacterized protein n=1 Tax=Anguilla anguilla TaxID=7936 RepID=A0A9D3M9F6_ANGAN|nr:hypothetical protein ANANG_G00148280 [Anguilla anguilla]
MCDLPWVSRIRLELVTAGSARHSGQQQAGWQCHSVRAAADRLAVPLSQGSSKQVGSASQSGQQQAGWQCHSVRAAADRLAVPLSQGAEAGVYIAVLCAVIERSEALSV